jgi:hypothetical protein
MAGGPLPTLGPPVIPNSDCVSAGAAGGTTRSWKLQLGETFMKRTLISLTVVAFIAAFAVSASAATSVTLTPTSTTVGVGGTITLQTFVTADGGELDNAVQGLINFPDAQVNSNIGGNSQVLLPGAGWGTGGFLCTTVFCTAFAQVNSIAPTAVGLTNSLIATTTFINTSPVGTVINFAWRTAPSTQRLDWFGITNAAGASVTVAAIPEPTTAAMIGLGLIGLAFAGRRRS